MVSPLSSSETPASLSEGGESGHTLVCDGIASENVPAHSRFANPPRLLLLAILFAAEALLLSIWLDNAALASRGGILPALVSQWGALDAARRGWIRRYLPHLCLPQKHSGTDRRFRRSQAHTRERRPAGGARWSRMAAFGSNRVGAVRRPIWGRFPRNLAASLWLAAGLAGMAFGAFALVAPALWARLVRETGFLLLYAVTAVVAACVVGAYIRELWSPMGRVTFELVKLLLTPFVSSIVSDPAKMILGTAKFSVEIAPECSGFEGVGLMLAFGTIWLCLFRRECRFPQALLLLPAGVVTIFLLNAVRLAALIMIGDAGAPQIALGGFHSQAGWIAFNVCALGFSVCASRVPWLTVVEARAQPTRGIAADYVRGNPTAAYLLPFLSILAVGVLATAVSGGFEWL